jgi:hypothetical protein
MQSVLPFMVIESWPVKRAFRTRGTDAFLNSVEHDRLSGGREMDELLA